MIKSFRHTDLRLFWEEGIEFKFPNNQIEKIRQILEVIDSAQQVPQDFEFFKSWKIHPLKGEGVLESKYQRQLADYFQI